MRSPVRRTGLFAAAIALLAAAPAEAQQAEPYAPPPRPARAGTMEVPQLAPAVLLPGELGPAPTGAAEMAPNTITVSRPGNGTQWRVGTRETISWTTSTSGDLRIDLYQGSGTLVRGLYRINGGGSGSVNWTVPGDVLPGDNYYIRIQSDRDPSIYAESAGFFSILPGSGPYFVVLRPRPGDRWVAGSTETITWAHERIPGSSVRIELYRGYAEDFRLITSSTANDGAYAWTLPTLEAGHDYYVVVESVSDASIWDASGRFSLAYPGIDLVGEATYAGESWAVEAEGSVALVANYTQGLRVFDVTTPSVPVARSAIPFQGRARDVAYASGLAVVALEGYGMGVARVSSGTAFRVAEVASSGGGYGVDLIGSSAYLASSTGLEVYDVSNPSAPVRTARWTLNSTCYDVEVRAGRAYVACGSNGVYVLDATNPAMLVEIGRFNTSGFAWDATVRDSHAYVSDGSGGLAIIDVAAPSSLQLVRTFAAGDDVYGVALEGDYAYLAADAKGLRVVNVRDPRSPVEVGHFLTYNRLYGVDAAAGLVYLADRDGGLYVVRNRLTSSGGGSMPSAQPFLTLSAGTLVQGASLTVQGHRFTVSGAARLYTHGPSGFTTTTALTAVNNGAFSTTFGTSSMPAGSYTFVAEDIVSGAFTAPKSFSLTAPRTTPGLVLTRPQASSGGTAGQPVMVEWTDFIQTGATYPAPNGAERLVSYDVAYSLNGGAWTVLPEAQVRERQRLNRMGSFVRSVTLPAGSVRIRVTDGYQPSRMAIGEPFTVRSSSADGAQVTLVWDKSHPVPPQHAAPAGVAADGVARIYLRVAGLGGRSLRQVNVVITDGDGSMSNDVPERLGRVMRATVRDADCNASQVACLEANGAARISDQSVQALSDGAHWFWYVAPDAFPGAVSADAAVLTASVSVTYSDATTQTFNHPIRIVRPPLMLVHGFGSGPETWDGFSLGGTQTTYLQDRRLIAPVAVKVDAGEGFVENSLVYLLNASSKSSFVSVIRGFRSRGYAANRVFYVGHSMGGLMLRAAAQRSRFYGDDTYGRGYVYRAVTINTPHLGSPWADLMQVVIASIKANVPSITERLMLSAIEPDGFIDALVRPSPDNGTLMTTRAVLNLKTLGGLRFGQSDVPTHMLAGNVLREQQFATSLSLPDSYLKAVDVLIWYTRHFGTPAQQAFVRNLRSEGPVVRTVEFLNYMLAQYSEASVFIGGDAVVSVNSQTSGLGQGSTSTVRFGGGWMHVAPPFGLSRFVPGAINSAGADVEALMHEPAGSSRFASLPAASIIPDEPSGTTTLAVQVPSVRMGLPLTITRPTAGQVLSVDSTAVVEIILSDTTGLRDVTVFFQGASRISTARSTIHRVAFPVSPAGLDAQKIEAFAVFDRVGAVVVEHGEAMVSVAASQAPQAFTTSTEAYALEVGAAARPRYTATFAGFTTTVPGTSSAVQVSVAEPSIVAFDARTGAFTGRRVGGTFAVVNYRGLADTLYFTVHEAANPVAADVAETLPARPTLEALYPNPARSVVTVAYTLSEPALVGITLYDLLGRRVSEQVSGIQGQGRYRAELDLSTLSAGVYLVRVLLHDPTQGQPRILMGRVVRL